MIVDGFQVTVQRLIKLHQFLYLSVCQKSINQNKSQLNDTRISVIGIEKQYSIQVISVLLEHLFEYSINM